jgi:phosphoribosylaminoimidazolecarboxamide formyltransferase/IMP cyclohydrolase
MKRVLISVSDKRGLVPLAKRLVRLGFEIIATEGTVRTLKKKGIPVKTVSEITGFKEILGGRVKTLHPTIFGGILARRSKRDLKELEKTGIETIDLVIVNLYPFKERLKNIDIGGVALIRAATKNFQNVGVIIDPEDYKKTLNELRKKRGNLSLKTKEDLAKKALAYILSYDRMVYEYLKSNQLPVTSYQLPEELFLEYEKVRDLRYGENPHQRATFYRLLVTDYRLPKQLWGKELSFNNILDLDVASNIVREFKEPTAVIIKHTNPCGVARDRSLVNAYRQARACDPLSAFGGVIGLNRKVDISTAREITSTFIEAVIAPEFTSQSLKILKKKKNLRVVQSPSVHLAKTDGRTNVQCQEKDLRTVEWGLLVQDRDIKDIKNKNFKTVTKRKPTKQELKALFFAWRVAKYVKSNAIVIGSENQILAIGAGQTSRIDALKIAISKMRNAECEMRNAIVMASDGFFPFRDSIDEAAKAKISAVIQPGGSIRDKEVIKACNEHNIAMVFTGIRHFRH